MRERLTILVIVGTRTDEHSLRSQVGIGSACNKNKALQLQRVPILSILGYNIGSLVLQFPKPKTKGQQIWPPPRAAKGPAIRHCSCCCCCQLQDQTCQVSRISRETHAFSISLALSLRTGEISRIFLLNEKQYFLLSQVFSFCGAREMRVLTSVLLLLTLGLHFELVF